MSESQQAQQGQQSENPELSAIEEVVQSEPTETQQEKPSEVTPVAPDAEEKVSDSQASVEESVEESLPEATPTQLDENLVKQEASTEKVGESPVDTGDNAQQAAPEEAASVIQPEPVAAAAASAEPVEVTTAGLSEELQYIEEVRRSGTDLQKIALSSIEAFCEAMKPRVPLTSTQANSAQRDLLSLFLMILRKDYEDFRKAWSLLLVYFAAHHGDRPTAVDYTALSEYSTGRYIDDWADVERAEAFVELTTLLRITRKTATRKNDVKRIRLDKVAAGLLSDHAKDNLQRFYS